MTYVIGVIGAAVLFGVFAMLRPRDERDGCAGHCVGCTGDGACERKREDEPVELMRRFA